MRNGKRNGTTLLKDTVYGMIGGAVGTIVMEQVASFLYKFESEEKKKREEELRKEMPFDAMARRLTEDVLHNPVADETRAKLGQVLHWGYGLAWGGLYGVLHDRVPTVSRAAGVPFGVGFSLIGDEWLNTAFKLTPPPQAFPIEAHARGLAAHVAYAAAADGVYRVLKKVGG